MRQLTTFEVDGNTSIDEDQQESPTVADNASTISVKVVTRTKALMMVVILVCLLAVIVVVIVTSNAFIGNEEEEDESNILRASTVVAGSFFFCAIVLPLNGVKCWGIGNYGQMGNGKLGDASFPDSVVGLERDVRSLCSGAVHSCAVDKRGAVKCWGANSDGKLGIDLSTPVAKTPVQVEGLSAGALSVTCGGFHSCALLENKTAVCWGYNGHGQLGSGAVGLHSYVPQRVAGLINVDFVAGGTYSTCAVVNASTQTYCWGHNGYGELGSQNLTLDSRARYVPVRVDPDYSSFGAGETIKAVEGGYYSFCGIQGSAGRLFCVGSNLNYQIGDASTRYFIGTINPVIGFDNGTVAVSPSKYSNRVCAVLNSGEARCWGLFRPESCCVGNGTGDVIARVPVRVAGEFDHRSIAVGKSAACSIRGRRREVWCWGKNHHGQLGNGTTKPFYDLAALVPQPVMVAAVNGTAD